jgi:hypothetical protein
MRARHIAIHEILTLSLQGTREETHGNVHQNNRQNTRDNLHDHVHDNVMPMLRHVQNVSANENNQTIPSTHPCLTVANDRDQEREER